LVAGLGGGAISAKAGNGEQKLVCGVEKIQVGIETRSGRVLLNCG